MVYPFCFARLRAFKPILPDAVGTWTQQDEYNVLRGVRLFGIHATCNLIPCLNFFGASPLISFTYVNRTGAMVLRLPSLKLLPLPSKSGETYLSA